jgi:hypothetical protein
MPDEILSVPQAKTVIEQLRAEVRRHEGEALVQADEIRKLRLLIDRMREHIDAAHSVLLSALGPVK